MYLFLNQGLMLSTTQVSVMRNTYPWQITKTDVGYLLEMILISVETIHEIKVHSWCFSYTVARQVSYLAVEGFSLLVPDHKVIMTHVMTYDVSPCHSWTRTLSYEQVFISAPQGTAAYPTGPCRLPVPCISRTSPHIGLILIMSNG